MRHKIALFCAAMVFLTVMPALAAESVVDQWEQRAELEWGSVEGPPTSGSQKVSRALEVPSPIRWPEPSLEGPFWKIWGQLQFEASYQKDKDAEGEVQHTDRAVLATAELFVELSPLPFVRGLFHFLHEDGDSGVNLDEAFVVLGQVPEFPGYLMGGRIYPAVGMFESFMVSDPITKEVFETQATAAEVGWSGEWFSLGLSGYNAAVRKPGEGGVFFANFNLRADLTPPPEALEGLKLRVGGAYTNNVAGSGFLEEQVPSQRVDSLVSGWSLSASAEYGKFALLAEYLRSGSFEAGVLDYAPAGSTPQPWAFNLELAWFFADSWRLAGRWEGGGDLYEEFPERQYGLTLAWEPIENLALALEYQRGYFADGAESDLVTSQLSIIF
jgi:hypothetical protein